MREEEYRLLSNFEKKYWWHVGRRKIIKNLIEGFLNQHQNLEILDVGCGTGGNYNLLKKYGEVKGIDASKTAIDLCKKNNFTNVVLGDCRNTGFDDSCFDLIIALDLLEHLEDEVGVLKEFKRILKAKGNIIVTVPAYKFIWSKHDENLHHKRRYLLKEIVSSLENNGFKVIKSSYIITFLAPIIVFIRLLENLLSHFFTLTKKNSYIILPEVINDFFIKILYFEAWLIKYVNFPFGISIVCIGQKKDE